MARNLNSKQRNPNQDLKKNADGSSAPVSSIYHRMLQLSSSGAITDGTGSTLPISVDRDTDRVGIGMLEPAAALHIRGDISASGNLYLEGSVHAQQYIVSSSVTSMSIAQASGSTVFGDTSDDTHTFIGDISASGGLHISQSAAAADMIVLRYIDNETTSQTVIKGVNTGGSAKWKINAGGDIYGKTHLLGPDGMTSTYGGLQYANSNLQLNANSRDLELSADGKIGLKIDNATGYVSSSTLAVYGNITASGNISASATSTGSFGRVEVGPGIGTGPHFYVKPSSDSGGYAAFLGTSPTGGAAHGGSVVIGDDLVVGGTNVGGNIFMRGQSTGLWWGYNSTAYTNYGIYGRYNSTEAGDMITAMTIRVNGTDTLLINSSSKTIIGAGAQSVTGMLAPNNLVSDLTVSGDIWASGSSGHITASGNISASGTIYASAFSSPHGDGDIDFSDSIDIAGNITASGDISASGDIYGNKFTVDYIVDKNYSGNTIQFPSTQQIDFNQVFLVSSNSGRGSLVLDGAHFSGGITLFNFNGGDNNTVFSASHDSATYQQVGIDIPVIVHLSASAAAAQDLSIIRSVVDIDNDAHGLGKRRFLDFRNGGGDVATIDFSGSAYFANDITASGNISASFTSTGSFGKGHFNGRLGVGKSGPTGADISPARLSVINYGEEETFRLADDSSNQGYLSFTPSQHHPTTNERCWKINSSKVTGNLHSIDFQIKQKSVLFIDRGGSAATDFDTGWIGMGTQFPNATLQISGTLNVGTGSFGGHITASGNISASATSTGSFGQGYFGGLLGVGAAPSKAIFPNLKAEIYGDVHLGNSGNLQLDAGSGIIFSAEPGLQPVASNLHILEVGGGTYFNGILLSGHVTASGNISASGDLYAGDLYVNEYAAGGHASVNIYRGDTAGSANITFGSNDDGYIDWMVGTPDSNDIGDGTDFFIGQGAATPRLVIDTSGNVGIGTDNPYRQLHISSSGGAGNIGLSDSAGYPIIDFFDNEATKVNYRLISTNNDKFEIRSGSNDALMTFLENGNVGIGNIDPQEALSVSGSISASGTITADNYGGNISGSATSTGSFGRVEVDNVLRVGTGLLNGGVEFDDVTGDYGGRIFMTGGADKVLFAGIPDTGRFDVLNSTGTTYFSVSASGNTTFTGHITASGNISAGGTVFTNIISSSLVEISSSGTVLTIGNPGPVYPASGPYTPNELQFDQLRIVSRGEQNNAAPSLYIGNLGSGNTSDVTLSPSGGYLYINRPLEVSSFISNAATGASGFVMRNGRGNQENPAFNLGVGNNTPADYAGMYGIGDTPSINFSTNSTRRLVIHKNDNSIPGGVETSGSLSVGTLGDQIGHITASGNISASGYISASQIWGGTVYDNNEDLGADYVFEPEYILRTLPEVEEHIEEHQHLPGIPAVHDSGGWFQLSVGQRDMKLLEKVEELTLYVIDLQKQIDELKKDRG